MALAILLWIGLSIVACLALLRAAARHRVTPTLEELTEAEKSQISCDSQASAVPQADPGPEKTFSSSLAE